MPLLSTPRGNFRVIPVLSNAILAFFLGGWTLGSEHRSHDHIYLYMHCICTKSCAYNIHIYIYIYTLYFDSQGEFYNNHQTP